MAEWRALISKEPIDPNAVIMDLRAVVHDAETFVSRMPTDKIGLLFLQAGTIVQADPDHLDSYQTHAAQRHSHWPTSSEISTAMLERYNEKPNGNTHKP